MPATPDMMKTTNIDESEFDRISRYRHSANILNKSRQSKERPVSKIMSQVSIPISELVNLAQRSAEVQMYRQIKKNTVKLDKIKTKEKKMRLDKIQLEKEIQ